MSFNHYSKSRHGWFVYWFRSTFSHHSTYGESKPSNSLLRTRSSHGRRWKYGVNCSFKERYINNTYRKLYLQKLLHVPDSFYNLLSICNLITDNNASISFDSHGYEIKDNWIRQVLLKDYAIMVFTKFLKNKALCSTLTAQRQNASLWHQRLGHPHLQIIRIISKHNHSLKIPTRFSIWNPCIDANAHKHTFDVSTNHNYKPFEFIHLDFWRAIPHTSFNDFLYYVFSLMILLDIHKFIQWITNMKVFTDFISFKVMVENQLLISSKLFELIGKEFCNQRLTQFHEIQDILQQITCP